MMIELTEEDAEKYKLFCEHYDKFALLLKAGVLASKNCSITLHIDNDSNIQRIDSQAVLFNGRIKIVRN